MKSELTKLLFDKTNLVKFLEKSFNIFASKLYAPLIINFSKATHFPIKAFLSAFSENEQLLNLRYLNLGKFLQLSSKLKGISAFLILFTFILVKFL